MARELDEAWVDEAIARYRRIERLRTECEAAAAEAQVTVHSPDRLVEVVVTASGEIRRVEVVGSLSGRSDAELSESIRAAVGAAPDAARWARRTLYAETLGGYLAPEPLSGARPGPPARRPR